MTSRRNFLKSVTFAATAAALPGLPVIETALASQQSSANDLFFATWLARQFAPGDDGRELSASGSAPEEGWIPAVVPGTILTTLLANNLIPDPYFGFNNFDNQHIPDVNNIGIGHYTYWFRTEFDVPVHALRGRRHALLEFRGINYEADVYLNGVSLLPEPWKGMFLRRRLDVTDVLRPGSANILAVLVKPPQPPGNPNSNIDPYAPWGSSCQGGDEMLGASVTSQVTGGWDFQIPMRDRNTGIWDKVTLSFTGPVVVDGGPLVRQSISWDDHGNATSARLTVKVPLINLGDSADATVEVTVGHLRRRVKVPHIAKGGTAKPIATFVIARPKLWWPNGLGDANLHPVQISVKTGEAVSDEQRLSIGIRKISSSVDPQTGGRLFEVNKVRVFIRGGNWITADAMLRVSSQLYDDQIRLFREANLNLVRVWGGGIVERPEFYDACDRHGILVWQEFPVTADCEAFGLNPTDKDLLFSCAKDAVVMLRNHPSLALWVGGNEAAPPGNLDQMFREMVGSLDPDTAYVSSSTSVYEGFGSDGPYGIQYPKAFYDVSMPANRTAFNPEYGSVGLPVAESIRAMMSAADANSFPVGITQETFLTDLNKTWQFHCYIPFFTDFDTRPDHVRDQLELYGKPSTLDEFCEQAQAAQYQQYKSLFEGLNAQMWTKYTGGNIWKAQSGWTSLRGFLYDNYLEQTGGLFGVRSAGEPLHIQLNLATLEIDVVNNTASPLSGALVRQVVCGADGRVISALTRTFTIPDIPATSIINVGTLSGQIKPSELYLVKLYLLDGLDADRQISASVSWVADAQQAGSYAAFRKLPTVGLRGKGRGKIDRDGGCQVQITLANPGDVLAFFVRLRALKSQRGERILPVFYDDNYLTILPGETVTVGLGFRCNPRQNLPVITAEGWNTALETGSSVIPVRWRLGAGGQGSGVGGGDH